MTVALPTIAQQLHTGLDTTQWVLTAYLLSLAAGLAASAYLAKQFGTRRVYLLSLIGFTCSSVTCAFAPTLTFLIAFRAIQGLLGAPLIPLAMSLMLGEGKERRRLPPAAGMMLFLAPAIGPAIGGILLQIGGWPLIFLVNVPFGALGVLDVLRLPKPTTPAVRAPARLDPLGILLLAGGLTFAIYGATAGPQQGWTSAACWPFLAVGAILLIAYVIWALKWPFPAVDLKLLRHPQSALAIGLSMLTVIVLFAMLFLLPIYVTHATSSSQV